MILQKDFTDIVANSLPADVRNLLKLERGAVQVAGDYCREVLRGNEPAELEIFAVDEGRQKAVIAYFADLWHWVAQVNTKDCQIFTHISEVQPAIKFSTTLFGTLEAVLKTFDFSVQQVGVYWSDLYNDWVGVASEAFWKDLLSQVAHFTDPEGNDPARSVVQMMRLAELGFHIPLEDVAKVLARFFAVYGALDPDEAADLASEMHKALVGK